MKTIKTFTHQGKTLTLSRPQESAARGDSPFAGVSAGAAANGLKVKAPGAGSITIDDLRLSTTQAAAGEPVTATLIWRSQINCRRQPRAKRVGLNADVGRDSAIQ